MIERVCCIIYICDAVYLFFIIMLVIPAIIHAPDGKVTINHIARHLGTTKQSAKQIVAAMEKKNYLLVTPSEQDKRAVNITITSQGWEAFHTCSERSDIF